jgi:NAD(P)-dependent dehydrogenase (short-subunit alcohol dehydrogenase family)
MPNPNEHMVVVGGTSGIGLPLAQAAHALGCTLTVAGRGAERAAAIAKSIGSNVVGRHLDLEDRESIRAALAEGPPIDHLVLVAIDPLATSVKTFDVAAANKALHVKLTGYLEVAHTVLPRLKSTSAIVLFGGLAKSRPYMNSTMVTVANAGIVGVMNTLAVELAPIRVNSVSPGLVGDSPKWTAAASKGAKPFIDALTAKTPAKRLASVSDVIDAVFFLLDNRSVNGHDLHVDGGIQLVGF